MFRQYFERGLTVIPLKNEPGKQKHPLLSGYTKFCKEPATEADIDLWEKEYPTSGEKPYGIGLPCGPANGITAIDIDSDLKEILNLCPPSPVIKVGIKGETRFFKYNPEIKSGRKELKSGPNAHDGIDFLNVGRQTALPPTIHPKTQKPFFWRNESLLDFDVAELPEFTLEDYEKICAYFKPKKTSKIKTKLNGFSGAFYSDIFPDVFISKDSRNYPSGSQDRLKSLAVRLIRAQTPTDRAVKTLLDADQKYHKPMGYFYDLRGGASDQSYGSPEENAAHFYESIARTLKEEIEKQNEAEGLKLICLGHNGENFYYTSSVKPGLTVLNPNTHMRNHFYSLLPREYWERFAPLWDKKLEGVVDADWRVVSSTLMDRCRERGVFDETKVRGLGVWRDRDRIIVHLGDRLDVDGKEVRVFDFTDTEYFYTESTPLASVSQDRVHEREVLRFLERFKTFLFYTKSQALLCLGWILSAPFCALLPWRPHLWVTGPSGSGKSTLYGHLQRWLKYQLYSIHVGGGTTEAGVRQVIKYNSIPVSFDEFDPRGPKAVKIIEGCLDLMRQASFGDGSWIIKGSAGHRSHAFSVRFMAAVTGINNILENSKPDQSRFFDVELRERSRANAKEEHERWIQFKRNEATFGQKFWAGVFAHNLEGIRSGGIFGYLDRFLKLFAHRGLSDRVFDQYGMVLSFFAWFRFGQKASEDDLKRIFETVDWDLGSADGIQEEDDGISCLAHLLGCHVVTNLARDSLALFQVIERVDSREGGMNLREGYQETLQKYGLRVTYDGGLFVSAKNVMFDRLFDGSNWHRVGRSQLKKIPGVIRRDVQKVLSSEEGITRPVKGFKIPKEQLQVAMEMLNPSFIPKEAAKEKVVRLSDWEKDRFKDDE